MLIHLPALVLTKEIDKVLQGLMQVGLDVRGLYGEGSEVIGNLFQISNQTTLGKPSGVLDHLGVVAPGHRVRGAGAASVLLRDAPAIIEDKVWRAYGLLRYALQPVVEETINCARRAARRGAGPDSGRRCVHAQRAAGPHPARPPAARWRERRSAKRPELPVRRADIRAADAGERLTDEAARNWRRSMHDKFTERVRKVIYLAREEAARLQHDYIGTEHLLLGVIREGEGIAATVLNNLGLDLDHIRQEIENMVKKGDRRHRRPARSRSRRAPSGCSSWRSRRRASSATTTSAPSTCCSA